MRESALEQRFNRKVQQRGGQSYKICPEYCAGIPDRMVLMPGGRLYLVELKADDGALRPIQRVWHERARELGTTVVVLQGNAEVDAWLESI
jgi:hypothetical protein